MQHNPLQPSDCHSSFCVIFWRSVCFQHDRLHNGPLLRHSEATEVPAHYNKNKDCPSSYHRLDGALGTGPYSYVFTVQRKYFSSSKHGNFSDNTLLFVSDCNKENDQNSEKPFEAHVSAVETVKVQPSEGANQEKQARGIFCSLDHCGGGNFFNLLHMSVFIFTVCLFSIL